MNHDNEEIANKAVLELKELREKRSGYMDRLLVFYENGYHKLIPGFTTWNKFVEKEFDLKSSQGYRIIGASKVKNNISQIIDETQPVNFKYRVSHLYIFHEKVKDNPDLQRKICKIVLKECDKITGTKLEKIVSVCVVENNLGLSHGLRPNNVLYPLYKLSIPNQGAAYRSFFDIWDSKQPASNNDKSGHIHPTENDMVEFLRTFMVRVNLDLVDSGIPDETLTSLEQFDPKDQKIIWMATSLLQVIQELKFLLQYSRT